MERMFRVLLHNDNTHTIEEVINALMNIFHITEESARHSTLAADVFGRGIVTIEPEHKAELHKNDMIEMGLGATIEEVDDADIPPLFRL